MVPAHPGKPVKFSFLGGRAGLGPRNVHFIIIIIIIIIIKIFVYLAVSCGPKILEASQMARS